MSVSSLSGGTPRSSTPIRHRDERHGEGGRSGGQPGRRSLDRSEKRLLALLGVPTFALALAVTVTTTYLPVVTRSFIGSSVALPVYGVGLLVPLFFTTPWVLVAVIPAVAFGGGVVMTLPYAILMPLMPEREHGALTGFYTFSRGVGISLGPLLAGVAISLLEPMLGSTDGYAAMWLVCGAAILASLLPLRRLRDGGMEGTGR